MKENRKLKSVLCAIVIVALTGTFFPLAGLADGDPEPCCEVIETVVEEAAPAAAPVVSEPAQTYVEPDPVYVPPAEPAPAPAEEETICDESTSAPEDTYEEPAPAADPAAEDAEGTSAVADIEETLGLTAEPEDIALGESEASLDAAPEEVLLTLDAAAEEDTLSPLFATFGSTASPMLNPTIVTASTSTTTVAPGERFTVNYSLTQNPGSLGALTVLAEAIGAKVVDMTNSGLLENGGSPYISADGWGTMLWYSAGNMTGTGLLTTVTFEVTTTKNQTLNIGGELEVTDAEYIPSEITENSSLIPCSVQVVVDPTTCSHVWGEAYDEVPADCTTAGSYKHDCTICEKTEEVPISALGHDMEHHEEQTPGTCTENGNIEYWYCKACKNYYLDKNGNTATTAEDIVIPADHLDLKHVEAHPAGACTENGNIEYWYCSSCNKYFSDAACKTEISAASVIIPAEHKNAVHILAREATCESYGNIEHWACIDCMRSFYDEAYTMVVENESDLINGQPLNHANVMHFEAKDAKCAEDGNIEYWYCPDCLKYYVNFTNAKGRLAVEREDTIIPAIGHDMEHTKAKDASCTEDGNVEYWFCKTCSKYFADKQGETEIAEKDIVIPAGHKGLKEFGEEPATCTRDGQIRYWYCSACNKYYVNYADAKDCLEVEQEDTVIPAHHLALSNVPAVAPSCTEDGNIEYCFCATCGKYFSDADCENEITRAQTADPMLGHDMTHTDAQSATCEEDGTNEYWYCSRCLKYFSDKAGNAEISVADTVIKATGHA